MRRLLGSLNNIITNKHLSCPQSETITNVSVITLTIPSNNPITIIMIEALTTIIMKELHHFNIHQIRVTFLIKLRL